MGDESHINHEDFFSSSTHPPIQTLRSQILQFSPKKHMRQLQNTS